MKKNATKLNKALARGADIAEIFKPFTSNEWIFSTSTLTEIQKSLSQSDRENFFTNVEEVNWERFLQHFAWGLKTFVLKEVNDTPANLRRLDLLSQQKNEDSYFLDIQWALNHGRDFQPSSTAIMTRKVLESEKVKRVIEKDLKKNYKRAQEICSTMFAEYNIKILRIFAWGLHKTFKLIFEKVIFNIFFFMLYYIFYYII